MRLLFAIPFAFLILGTIGCKTSNSDNLEGAAKPRQTAQATVVTNKPAVRPADILSGRVIAVREPLRFVIVDFANNKLPKMDQRLNVYRLDQKVAEIKVSGPFLGSTVAADITVGQALQGDLVRDR
jgi:hypothetical protein